jgi:hypothetical protein
VVIFGATYQSRRDKIRNILGAHLKRRREREAIKAIEFSKIVRV